MAAEFQFGDYILVQDGRTMEIFHRDLSESRRYHVAFLGVDVQPHRDGFKVRLGARRGDDQVTGGVSLKMNAEEFDAVPRLHRPGHRGPRRGARHPP